MTDLTPEQLAEKIHPWVNSNYPGDFLGVGEAQEALVELVSRAAALDAERARADRAEHLMECADTPLMRDVLARNPNLEAVAEAAREYAVTCRDFKYRKVIAALAVLEEPQ